MLLIIISNEKTAWPFWQYRDVDMYYDRFRFQYELASPDGPVRNGRFYYVYEPENLSGVSRLRYEGGSFDGFESAFDAIQPFFGSQKNQCNNWIGTAEEPAGTTGTEGTTTEEETAEESAGTTSTEGTTTESSDSNACEEGVLADVFDQFDADVVCGKGVDCGRYIVMDIYEKQFVIMVGGWASEPKIIARKDCTLTPDGLTSNSNAWSTFFTEFVNDLTLTYSNSYINIYWEYANENQLMPERSGCISNFDSNHEFIVIIVENFKMNR